jgi:predicted permease
MPSGAVAEAIIGDLEQEYRGRPSRLWYVRQAVGIVVRSSRDRLRGRSWFAGLGGGGEGPGRDPKPPRAGAGLLLDLRFAVRMLVQRPLFSFVAVGTLAVGMAINTAIFSVTNALILTPIPAIRAPETVVEIARGTGNDYVDVAWGAFQIVREESTTLQDVAGWDGITLAYRDRGESEARVVSGREVTSNYFSVLGVEPAHGRFFDPESFWPDVPSEIVITHHLWEERYGGSLDVLGREVIINGTAANIIGVAPEGFGGHQVLVQRDVFVPIGMQAPGMLGSPELTSVRSGYMVLLGRLAEGAGIDAVREELTVLGDRFYAENGVAEPYRLRVDPYGGLPASDRSMVSLFFALLMLITTMVMAIACVNVANMLLSRGIERRREIAIRMSLGAGRWRVVRQLLTESSILFLIAAAGGVLLTAWTTDVLVRLYLPRMTSTRLFLDVSPDMRVLAFALLTAALTGLIFGLAPALAATRTAGAAAPSAAGGQRTPRLRGALVGAQMALTLMLLVAGGLMARTLQALESIDLGFDVEGLYSVALDVEHAGYDADRTRVFYRQLLDEVRAVPAVEAAATARKLPMASASTTSGIFPDGIEAPSEWGFPTHFNRVSTDYFRTVGVPLLEGREFGDFDDENAPLVAIVNTTLATRLWNGESAVGKRFTFGRGEAGRRYEVVGVAADAHYHTFVEETPSFLYLSAAQSPDTLGHVLVRADLASTIGDIRAIVSRLDPDVPVVEVATMREVVDGFSMGPRLAAWVAGVVGLVGLALGAVGVYGVTAFSVGQRAHEVGVRIALGARAVDVQRLFLRSGMRAPLAGMAVGLVFALAASRLLGAFLYGVSSADPWTYVVVVLVLGVVALGAIVNPARRAAALDPVETLRSE